MRTSSRLVPLAVLLLSGCGSPNSSGYSVNGAVTWKGEPLGQGSIQFVPEGGQGQRVGAEIDQGRYALPNPPGLVPGHYAVRINSRTGPAHLRDARSNDPATKELIPKPYNETTTLKAELTPDGPQTFDFNLIEPPARATGSRAAR